MRWSHARLAEALGAHGERVERPEDVASALERASTIHAGWPPGPAGGYTSDFPILSVDGIAGTSSPPEVVVGVLEDRARALFAELGWPPPER